MYKWTYNDMVCLIVQMKLYAVNELDLPVMGVYSRTRKISVLLILCTHLPRQRSSLSCSHQLHQLANPTYLNLRQFTHIMKYKASKSEGLCR